MLCREILCGHPPPLCPILTTRSAAALSSRAECGYMVMVTWMIALFDIRLSCMYISCCLDGRGRVHRESRCPPPRFQPTSPFRRHLEIGACSLGDGATETELRRHPERRLGPPGYIEHISVCVSRYRHRLAWAPLSVRVEGLAESQPPEKSPRARRKDKRAHGWTRKAAITVRLPLAIIGWRCRRGMIDRART